MRNIRVDSSDGICVSEESGVIASRLEKGVLVFLNLIRCPPYFYLAAIMPGEGLIDLMDVYQLGCFQRKRVALYVLAP